MSQLHKILIAIVIGAMVMPHLAEATSLGAVEKNNFVKISSGGQSAEFTMLFWTRENSTFPVFLEFRKIPEGWSGKILPEKFALPLDENFEMILLPDVTLKAKPVKVKIDVPQEIEFGKYDIEVKALTGGSDGEVSVLQERIFRFSVIYEKEKTPLDVFLGTVSQFFDSVGKNLVGIATGNVPLAGETFHPFYAVIASIAALAFIWVIYRRV